METRMEVTLLRSRCEDSNQYESRAWKRLGIPKLGKSQVSQRISYRFCPACTIWRSIFGDALWRLDGWKKNPNAKYKDYLIKGLQEKFNAPEPNLIWNHRWKYAQAQMPLLGREGALDLDSEAFENWKHLCKDTGFTILGDWLFGAKIERIIGGIYFLSHNDLL